MEKTFKNKHKVLITGGCGFVGLNLVKHLLERTNWKINVLDNLSTNRLESLNKIRKSSKKRINFFKGDIRNKKDIEKAIRGCDFLVHLAAQTGVIPSQKNPEEDAFINIIGTINLLKIAIKRKIKKFVFISSAAPLGNQKMPLNEKKIPQPLSPYGASKLAGEAYCSAFSASFGLKTTVLRASNIYGPFSDNKESIIANFIKRILRHKPVIIYGLGKQTRDFIYVKDVCEAIYLSLIKKLPHGFEVFQIGTGQETSIGQLFRLIKEEFEKRGYNVQKPIYKPERKGEVKRSYTDISKARKFLGFKPKIKLTTGIQNTIEWFLTSSF